MVNYPGLGLYKAIYLFDNIINLGIIWVEFDFHQNEFHKVLSMNSNFSTDSVPAQKRKETNIYQPGTAMA